RAKALGDRRGDHKGRQVLPVIVHGDAAFAGQGVVMETLALAQTRGYYTGGTVHLVLNNQIRCTTSHPRRHQFNKNVRVDIVCFRKLGHNEQDTPSLTQPLMYKKIAVHPGTRKLYGDKLVAQGVLGATGPDDMGKEVRAPLDAGRHTRDPVLTNFKGKYAVDWSPFLHKKWTDAADTALPVAEFKRLAERITTIPGNFKVHPLVEKVVADRAAMGRGGSNGA